MATSQHLRQLLRNMTQPSVYALLVELDHPELAQPVRVVRAPTPVVSEGNTYMPARFALSLPDERTDTVVATRIQFDNVDKELYKSLRNLVGNITMRLRVVLAETPDVVEMGPMELVIRTLTFDARKVEGTATYHDFLQHRFPADLMTSTTVPGIFVRAPITEVS